MKLIKSSVFAISKISVFNVLSVTPTFRLELFSKGPNVIERKQFSAVDKPTIFELYTTVYDGSE